MCIKELEYRTQLSGIFLPLDGAFQISSTKNFPLKLGFNPEIKIILFIHQILNFFLILKAYHVKDF